MTKVDPKTLRLLLRYDPDTGNLFWLKRQEFMFKGTALRSAQHACANWNARFADRPALAALNGAGYRHGTILNRQYLAHRVIWAIQTGAWPEHDIDHADADHLNNRWGNLREATHAENMRNCRISRANKSGVKGVFWNAKTKKWVATISVSNRTNNLGGFDCKEDATAAYAKASAEFHGQFGRVG